MKALKITVLISLLSSVQVFAQNSFCGYVFSLKGHLPIANAHVLVQETGKEIFTNEKGEFCFESGETLHHLSIEALNFAPDQFTIRAGGNKPYFYLDSLVYELAEAVITTSTRLDEDKVKTAVTLKKEALQKINTGKDLPVLLQTTPSLVTTSDAGNGIGYTQFRIRGMDLTRINVTVNGIPINDQESHGVWWVNMPDITSSINTIQVQRGVGTSTNGGQAFGSSVNIETTKMALEPSAQVSLSAGSFNSMKTTAEFSTGLLQNNWGFSGRLSKISSDGYVDRASSDLKSYYFAAHYLTEKQSFRITAFSGKEKTYQSWYGITDDDLLHDRTKNYYTYQNQTDNYQQDNYQMHYSRYMGNFKANAAIHYTLGRGYYEEYKPNDSLNFYGINNVNLGGVSIKTSDIVRQRWLYNNFVGGIYSLEHKYQTAKGARLKTTFGGDYNQYFGQHYGKVIWARYAANSEIGDKYYNSNAIKRNFNNYLKFNYEKNLLTFQAEMQARSVHYEFEGISNQLKPLNHAVDFLFLNPKAMLSYQAREHLKTYAYYGKSSREPIRDDYVNTQPNQWPKPETVHDFEAGFTKEGEKLTVNFNLYYMYFINQLVQSGEINNVGAYLRKNVGKSYRRGIELEISAKINRFINWNGNITLSQNKLANWTSYIDVYDANDKWLKQETVNYKNTTIGLSPSVIGFSNFDFKLMKNLQLSLQTKYVGKQYLDNTQSEERKINAYLINDLILNYNLKPNKYFKSLRVQAMAYNFLNELYESSGYTFLSAYQGSSTVYSSNYYYPQAGRNFMLGLIFGF
ncbi:TonB-dependent receptor [bacterium]|nr:TonB-dependent receptor [bacterium]